MPSENWTVDDNATFQSAFSLFGKDFGLINKWLPHKTTRELVDFYYWLKSKNQIKSPKVQTSTLNTQNTGEYQIKLFYRKFIIDLNFYY